jgi:hypothetical protein
MGGYEVCKAQLGATDPASMPVWKKIVAGGIAGATGAASATGGPRYRVRGELDALRRAGYGALTPCASSSSLCAYS